MSQFTAGFRTMERRKELQETSSESETLLRSEPSSPEVWEMSAVKPIGKPVVRFEEKPMEPFQNGTLHFVPSNSMEKSVPIESEDVEHIGETVVELPDWRRSAVLTVFIFPPTGLLAMILACLSHNSAQKGEYVRARRLGCFSCWMVFISLLLSLTFIMACILLRLYGYVDNPF